MLPLALELKADRIVGELTDWRRRAGLDADASVVFAEPYALQLAGDWAGAAALWAELASPYEAALALAEADEEEPLRRALAELQALEARPAAAIVSRRLRERGVRELPRGPRPATRQNPYGLTARELEVLVLVSEGIPTARSPRSSCSPSAPSIITSVRFSASSRCEHVPRRVPRRPGWIFPTRSSGCRGSTAAPRLQFTRG